MSNLQIKLAGKTVTVEVEVVDGSLNYNILLGRPWVYAMVVVVSMYFHTIAFPHKGGSKVIVQLALFASISKATRSIPLVHEPPLSLQSVGVGLFKDLSLMVTFTLPSPSDLVEVARVETCNMISSTSSDLRRITNNSKVDSNIEVMRLSPIDLA